MKKKKKNLKGWFHKYFDLVKKTWSEENSQFKTQWPFRLSLIKPIYKLELSPFPQGRGSSLHHRSFEERNFEKCRWEWCAETSMGWTFLTFPVLLFFSLLYFNSLSTSFLICLQYYCLNWANLKILDVLFFCMF